MATMPTNVGATNWPTRKDARHNMPRESTRGQNVASPRTRDKRRKLAVAGKLDQLLANAQRFAQKSAQIAINEARDVERDKAARAVADACIQRRIDTDPTREHTDEPTAFVGDKLGYFKRAPRAKAVHLTDPVK